MIRIRCDAKNSPVSLGVKFGCEPREEATCLIQHTKDLGLNLHGFSFHVGTPCLELDAYRRGIKMCKQLIAFARSIGCKDAQLIDIGGGFSSVCGEDLDVVLTYFYFSRTLIFIYCLLTRAFCYFFLVGQDY